MATVTQDGDGFLVRLKVVPGSSRDAIGGLLGDRIKVKVAAAAESGKANKAVCDFLARTLGVKPRDVEIVTGQTSPEKLVRVRGITVSDAIKRLGVST